MMRRWIVSLFALVLASTTFAAVYDLPANGDSVIGANQDVGVKAGDTASTFARRNDIGYYQLLEANPTLDPLHVGQVSHLLVPNQVILPDAPREGIVINLAELRLYYYPQGTNKVVTYPVGIGRIGSGNQWQTPTGDLTIIEKQKDPEWRVPDSVKADLAKRGKPLPDVVPAGPDNPLGDYMMRLSNITYLIHGTNKPYVVGRRTSAGCVDMYPEDIEQLFNAVPLGTKVTIVNQPFKAGWLNGQLYFEAHRPLREQRMAYAGNYENLWNTALKNATTGHTVALNQEQVQAVAQKETGVAVVIAQAATPTTAAAT